MSALVPVAVALLDGARPVATHVEPEPHEPPAGWPLPVIGDPSLGGDGIRIAVDAVCPACGWPERVYDTLSRRFGCVQCPHTSDERNG